MFANTARLIRTIFRHVAKLVTVATHRVVILSGEMFGAAAFTAGLNLDIVVA